MLHFSFGLAVPSTPESVPLAQGSLCIVGRIGAFDVERLKAPIVRPSIVFDENEIFRGVIAQGFIGFSTMFVLKRGREMTCPKYDIYWQVCKY